MRRPLLTSPDYTVFAVAFAALLLMAITEQFDHRAMNNALSVTVVALWTYRLIGTWHELTVLEHALVILGITGPLAATAASLNLLAQTGELPVNHLLWAVTAHRVACVALALWWRRWIGRSHSPFRRGPDVRRSSPFRRDPQAG